MAGLTPTSVRLDKKCGKSGIAANKKCGKATKVRNIALGAGAVAGVAGLALLARRRWGRRDPNWKGFSAPGEDWDRIEAEARKGGKKWDVFEENKKANAVACAATKVDAWVREDVYIMKPRCLGGDGAYGNYVVHPSEKYGIKYIHNGGRDPKGRKQTWSLRDEGEALDYANSLHVPTPKLYKATDSVLVVEHLGQHKQLSKYSWVDDDFNLSESAPFEVKHQLLQSFRSLHHAGLAHNDAHFGNIMYNAKTRDMRFIDFGHATYSTEDPYRFTDEVFPVFNRIGMSAETTYKLHNRLYSLNNTLAEALTSGEAGRADKLILGHYRSIELALFRDSGKPRPRSSKRQP